MPLSPWPTRAGPKPRPKLLEKREQAAGVKAQDRVERQKCHERSGMRCEVVEPIWTGLVPLGFLRCNHYVTQNHHLLSGIGRRNRGRSIFAEHRIDVCDRCHQDITGHVLEPSGDTMSAALRWSRRK